MAKKQVRNNSYYEERLKRDFPAIYSDLKAGRYSSVSEAKIAAGLSNPRTRLHELKNAWSKAPTAERNEFLKWLSTTGTLLPLPGPIAASTAAPTPAMTKPIVSGRHLLPATATRIREIMAKRNLRSGDVMAEMGFNKLDASLASALARNSSLQLHVITALEKWLVANTRV